MKKETIQQNIFLKTYLKKKLVFLCYDDIISIYDLDYNSIKFRLKEDKGKIVQMYLSEVRNCLVVIIQNYVIYYNIEDLVKTYENNLMPYNYQPTIH